MEKLDMANEMTKIPLSKELWERAHVAYVIREAKSVSKQEAVRAILQAYVDRFDAEQAADRAPEKG